MKTEQIIDILNGISDATLEKHFEMKEKLKRKRNIRHVLKRSSAVACLMLVVMCSSLALSIINANKTGNSVLKYVSVNYKTVDEAESEMNIKTLLSNLKIGENGISVSYRSEDLQTPIISDPLFAVVYPEALYDSSETACIYVYFKARTVEGGKALLPKKEGTEMIGDVEVHFYSNGEEELPEINARFVYNEKMYSITVADYKSIVEAKELLNAYLDAMLENPT